MTSAEQHKVLQCELNSKQLMQQAREQSGLTDYGDESFARSLDKLLDCVAHDTNFHATGLKEFKEEIVRNLVNRLRLREVTRRHPEILEEDISDPIIIMGLPRSGTTKTQRMLGTDPNLLKTYMWQLFNPAPFPDTVPGQPDPRIAAAGLGDQLADDNPDVQAGHHMAAEQIEEDWPLFEHTFNDWYVNARTPTHSWQDWVMTRTDPPDIYNYRYVHYLFQHLQWQQGGRRNRRWLMKHCGHHAHMTEMLEVFPQASLTHVHRHPAASVPSLGKLLLDIWSMRVDNVDPKFVGELVFNWTQISIANYLKDRDRLELNERIFDVPYDQIRNDPMPVFREIYHRAGHTLTAESERGMMQWEKSNEQGKHGKHVYSLEMFGLSEQKIDNAFGEYIQRFIKH